MSIDSGRTWRTFDLGDSEPFKAVWAMNRFPAVRAHPDGRIVTGYFKWWIAEDVSNTSFRALDQDAPELRQAGFYSQDPGPLVRGNKMSPDEGKTWISLAGRPRERLRTVG